MAKRTKKVVTKAMVKEVIANLRAGGTSLWAESQRLGFKSNGPLRRELRTKFGAEGYREFIAQTSIGPAGGVQRSVPIIVDPPDLPRMSNMRTKDGWRSRAILHHGHTRNVYVSPDGTQYIAAQDTEPANLIVDHTGDPRFRGLPTIIRLRLYEDSKIAEDVAAAKVIAKRKTTRRKNTRHSRKPRA